VIAADGSSLETVLLAAGRAWPVRVTADGDEKARVAVPPGAAAPPREARAQLISIVRHMLRLDEDLSAFYAAAAADPVLAWIASGAGRMLRGPTVFEDIVKTICTTNCAWSATQRMVGALVGELGTPVADRPDLRAFPSAEQLAAADASFYREAARAGYRGAYLHKLATDVAGGRLDIEAFDVPELSDDEVATRLLGIAGVGPYAVAHMMMLLGRYRRLILDSWTRPKYRSVSGHSRITDKGIERAFRRYREFAGLAFWLTLTEDWLPSRVDAVAEASAAGLAEGSAGSPAARQA
jgi:3-methyladenine DNA glycosylase/8-oxoguanine DNA glycosylase